jgi:hypothetical protein
VVDAARDEGSGADVGTMEERARDAGDDGLAERFGFGEILAARHDRQSARTGGDEGLFVHVYGAQIDRGCV